MFLSTIYITYIVYQPFIANTNVYRFASNLNPNALNDLNTVDKPINIIYIILVYLLFYGLSTTIYFINNKFILRKAKREN